MEDQHPAFFRTGVIYILFNFSFSFSYIFQDKILRIWFVTVKLKPVKAGYSINWAKKLKIKRTIIHPLSIKCETKY